MQGLWGEVPSSLSHGFIGELRSDFAVAVPRDGVVPTHANEKKCGCS